MVNAMKGGGPLPRSPPEPPPRPPPPAKPGQPATPATPAAEEPTTRRWTPPPRSPKEAAPLCAAHEASLPQRARHGFPRVVAAATALFPALDALANGQPHDPPAPCDDQCAALAATAGLTRALTSDHSALRGRALRLLQQLASADGSKAIVLTAYAPIRAQSATPAGGWAVEPSGFTDVTDDPLSPLLALLALGAGGVTRIHLRLVRRAVAVEGGEADARLMAWSCALGVDLAIKRFNFDGSGSDLAALGSLPPEAADAPHLLLLAGGGEAEAWSLTSAILPLGGIVLGLLPLPTQPELISTFVATPADAMALHLAGGEQGAEGLECRRCEALAVAVLRNRCLLYGLALEEGAWQVLTLLHELAAAWPIGYRVEERCESIADALGRTPTGGVRALCAHHGCGVAR